MNFNKLRFPWKPVDVQRGTISENACIGECLQSAKFHPCIKKWTICLKFRAMPPDYKATRIVKDGQDGRGIQTTDLKFLAQIFKMCKPWQSPFKKQDQYANVFRSLLWRKLLKQSNQRSWLKLAHSYVFFFLQSDMGFWNCKSLFVES